MAAFKQHAAFNLWQGSMIAGKDGRTLDGAMGQFGRLTAIADLPGKRELTGYVREAMKLIDAGAKRPANRQQASKLLAELFPPTSPQR